MKIYQIFTLYVILYRSSKCVSIYSDYSLGEFNLDGSNIYFRHKHVIKKQNIQYSTEIEGKVGGRRQKCTDGIHSLMNFFLCKKREFLQ